MTADQSKKAGSAVAEFVLIVWGTLNAAMPVA
jgi:hypothetical protein